MGGSWFAALASQVFLFGAPVELEVIFELKVRDVGSKKVKLWQLQKPQRRQ
jgi:hypothetical protein